MPSAAGPGSKAGIVTTETGERHIPASVRADGSTRKEIRIRPGYRPPEDVEVYKNRTAEGFRSRGSGGVLGAQGVNENVGMASKGNSKTAKRKDTRKKAKALNGSTVVAGGEGLSTASAEPLLNMARSGKEDERAPQFPENVEPDPEIEQEKRVRKLKKKLREAKELRARKEKGESLLHDQFEKVIRINELLRELDKLGFNADGEPKDTLEQP